MENRALEARTKSTYTSEYKRFRSLIVKARLDAGLTQADLAARLKRPQSFVSKVESGERRLDVIEWLQLLRAVGFDPVEFVAQLLRRKT